MQAIGINEAGPPSNLRIVDLDDSAPGRGEIRVLVDYAGVNRGDLLRRDRGMFPPGAEPPYILGFEGLGTVDAVGKQVTRFKSGDRVGFLVDSGAYARQVVVPIGQVFPIPASLRVDEPQVVASICVGTTAWHLLRLASLRSGMTVLVHGGAGAVGAALTQLAQPHRVNVISVVGSEEREQYAHSIGANSVVNHATGDFADAVLDHTGGAGVDVIFDCVGQSVVDGNLRVLRPGGQWMYYGSASGHATFPGLDVLSKALTVQGFVIFNMFQRQALWGAGVSAVLTALRSGILQLRTELVPMSDAPRAHELAGERDFIGKVVLDMRQPAAGGSGTR